jgi:predicted MFS family arabinose efflux permease
MGADQRGGFQYPFMVTGIMTLITVIPLIYLLPRRSKTFVRHSDVSVRKILMAPGVVLVVIAASFAMSVFSFLELALQPHFIKRNLSSSELGLFFLLISAVYAMCSPIVGFLTTPRNTRSFIVLGLTMISFALCLLGPAPIGLFPTGFGYQIFSLVIISAGCSLVLVPVVPSMTMAVLHLGNHATDVVAGVITSSFSMGESVGPIVGGFLLQKSVLTKRTL